MKFLKLKDLAFLAAAALLPSHAVAGLILDGGFESASLAEYTTGPIGDGWSVLGGTIQILDAATGFGSVPHSGTQFADLDFGISVNQLSQTLTTTPGQFYTISFWLSDDVGSNQFSVAFGGDTLTSFITTALGDGNYQQMTFSNVEATSASTALTFTGQWMFGGAGGGVGTVIDDVDVEAQSTVPEPASWMAAAAGLLALATFCAVRRDART